MSALARFFLSLNGTWSFTRRIDGSIHASASGTAGFTPQDALSYHYREEGELHLPDGTVSIFFRHYLYHLSEPYLDVLYGDGPQQGQPYQSYVADESGTQLLPLATHLCSADTYRGIYTLAGDNGFNLTTSVKGPHKDYTIATDYRRTASAISSAYPS